MAELRSDTCPVFVASLQAAASVGLKVALQGGLTALSVASWLVPLKSKSFVESPAGDFPSDGHNDLSKLAPQTISCHPVACRQP